jgi:hypothetical protein
VNVRRRIAAAALTAAAAAGVIQPPAHSAVDPAINGVYIATSDGRWAKKNEVRREEATVISMWTIATTCSGAYDCKGTMTTDQGWSAEIVYISGMWFVTRALDSWVPCPDGTAEPGRQIFKFYEDREVEGRYLGWDTAAGPSGACGVNRPVFIEIPFTLVRK